MDSRVPDSTNPRSVAPEEVRRLKTVSLVFAGLALLSILVSVSLEVAFLFGFALSIFVPAMSTATFALVFSYVLLTTVPKYLTAETDDARKFLRVLKVYSQVVLIIAACAFIVSFVILLLE